VKKRALDLEVLISYVLRIGVIVSIAVEALGLGGYFLGNGVFQVDFAPSWQTGGRDFFAYVGGLLFSLTQGVTPVSLIALGIILLLMTPYVRVVASVVYFAIERNPRYTLISLFVLVVLTASLTFH